MEARRGAREAMALTARPACAHLTETVPCAAVWRECGQRDTVSSAVFVWLTALRELSEGWGQSQSARGRYERAESGE